MIIVIEATRTESFKSDAAIPIRTSNTVNINAQTIDVTLQGGVTIGKRLSLWAAYLSPLALTNSVTYSAIHNSMQAGIMYIHRRKY